MVSSPPSSHLVTSPLPVVNADARALVLRLKIGDDATARDAFSALFRVYYESAIQFVCRYVGARDVAEDVAQDTFVRLWERRATIDPDRPFRALLFSAARHRALNLLAHDAVVRAHAERSARFGGSPAEAPHAPPADAALLADELARITAIRVAALTPRQREIYHLSREDGLAPAEIAEVLGIAPATVYVQLARIVHALFPAVEAWTRGE